MLSMPSELGLLNVTEIMKISFQWKTAFVFRLATVLKTNLASLVAVKNNLLNLNSFFLFFISVSL